MVSSVFRILGGGGGEGLIASGRGISSRAGSSEPAAWHCPVIIIMMISSMMKTDDKNPHDGMMLLKSNDEHA